MVERKWTRHRSRGRAGGPPHTRRPEKRSGGNASWLYGTHAVLAALANPRRRCLRLLTTREMTAAVRQTLAGRAGPPVASEVVPRERIEAMLPPGAVHQGVALEADPLPAATVEQVIAAAAGDEQAVVVVLDRISDPGNLGAVLRSAAAFGATGVVIPDRHSPAATPAVAKAASGALETVLLARVPNLARALDGLKAAGFWCVGLDNAAATSLTDADLPDRTALVLGAEGSGLRRLTRARCDLIARIPISCTVESLNLSTAAAVALYEAARQRS